MSKLVLPIAFAPCALLAGCLDASNVSLDETTSAITNRIQNLVVYTYVPGVAGAPKQSPRVGDSYGVTVEFDVSGAAELPAIEIGYTLANYTCSRTLAAGTTGHQSVQCDFGVMPIDGSLPVSAKVDTLKAIDGTAPTAANGRVASATFTVKPPSTATELYDPVYLIGTQTLELKRQSGGTPWVDVMAAAPATDGSTAQTTLAVGFRAGTAAATSTTTPTLDRYHQPVFTYDGPLAGDTTFTNAFEVMVSNERVDPDKLRTITWADYDYATTTYTSLANDIKPESVIQSDDPKIIAFVTNTLGANYKQTMTPYDAARKMFQVIAGRSTYVAPPVGNAPDERAQDAVQMLETRKGDCGSFTMLLVAVFRAMGMPARGTAGAWQGPDYYHAWAELYFPRYEQWIVTDGAGANGWDPTGTYVYCFGASTDRNQRLTVARYSSFTSPTSPTPFFDISLQTPSFSAPDGGVVYVAEHTTIVVNNDAP